MVFIHKSTLDILLVIVVTIAVYIGHLFFYDRGSSHAWSYRFDFYSGKAINTYSETESDP